MKWFSRRASYTEVITGSEEEAGGRIGNGGPGGSDERNISSQTNGQRGQPNFIDFIGVVLPKDLNSFYMVKNEKIRLDLFEYFYRILRFLLVAMKGRGRALFHQKST